MLQRIIYEQDILPNPSSYTSTVWPMVGEDFEENELASLQIGYDIEGPIIMPMKEAKWDDVIDGVLSRYQEVWERLAEL